MQRLILGSMAVGLFLSGTVAQAAGVTFFDGTFLNSEWQLTTFTSSAGGTVTPSQQLSGGNPGAYRDVIDLVNGPDGVVYGVQIRPLAVYVPAIQGAILSGTFSIDTIALHIVGLPNFGQGEATRMALLQNGNLYFRSGTPFSANQSAWTAQGPASFVQDNFSLIAQGPSGIIFDFGQHPDFSLTGTAIEFGYITANSTNLPNGYTIEAGFDNWTVTLNTDPVPEPGSFVILLSGLGVLGLTRLIPIRAR